MIFEDTIKATKEAEIKQEVMNWSLEEKQRFCDWFCSTQAYDWDAIHKRYIPNGATLSASDVPDNAIIAVATYYKLCWDASASCYKKGTIAGRILMSHIKR